MLFNNVTINQGLRKVAGVILRKLMQKNTNLFRSMRRQIKTHNSGCLFSSQEKRARLYNTLARTFGRFAVRLESCLNMYVAIMVGPECGASDKTADAISATTVRGCVYICRSM